MVNERAASDQPRNPGNWLISDCRFLWHRNSSLPSPTYVARRLLKQFIAVIVGNVIYFYLLMARLPSRGQHQPFHIDIGLLVDVWICLALYGFIELLDRNVRSKRDGKK